MQRQDRKNVQKNNWRIAQSEHGSLGSLGSKKCKHVLSSSRAYLGWTAAILTFAEWVTGIGTSLLDISCLILPFRVPSFWKAEFQVRTNLDHGTCWTWRKSLLWMGTLWHVMKLSQIQLLSQYIESIQILITAVWPVSIAEEAWPLLFTHVLFLPLHNGQHNELQAACLAVPKKTPHDQILKKRKQNEGCTPPATKCDKTFESLSSPSEDSERTHSSSRSSTLETLGLNWARSKRNVHPRRSKAVLIKKEGFWKLNYTANRHVTNNTCLNAPTHERSNW